MLQYSIEPTDTILDGSITIKSFLLPKESSNIDWTTVESFGEEWTKFSDFSEDEINHLGAEYFDIVSDNILNQDTLALDVGCGTGRWTRYVADRVNRVEAIDPSKAVIVASKLLADKENVRISVAEVSNIPFDDNSFDFVFSLGVLHHIPDTFQGICDCVKKIKPGGYFLIYLYYDLDNRGVFYRLMYKLSDFFRKGICKLPAVLKKKVCDLIAFTVYKPIIFLAWLVKVIFGDKTFRAMPLSIYVDKTFNVIRNDALDRFGTPLEHRYTKQEIRSMLEKAGMINIIFSDKPPFWHAIGQKKNKLY